MNLNQIKPIGPHIEGFIRFASTGQGDSLQQLDYFEVLSKVHESQESGKLPVLKSHPIAANLIDLQKEERGEKKIRVIPIRLIADKPENSLNARYEAYDTELGRQVCVGDGEKCERAILSKGITQSAQCAGPEACDFANTQGNQCSLHVRLKVQIEGQKDALSTFELQSGGINTYRTLAAKLQMMYGLFKKQLRGVPLELAIYDKSSVTSAYRAFYVADLRLRDGLTAAEALKLTEEFRSEQDAAGLDFAAMEVAIEQMSTNGALAINETDSSIVTYSAGIVDRSILKRPSAREAVAVERYLGFDIAGLVNTAKQNAVSIALVQKPLDEEAKIGSLEAAGPRILVKESVAVQPAVELAPTAVRAEAPMYAL
jgi:hypothetical protein